MFPACSWHLSTVFGDTLQNGMAAHLVPSIMHDAMHDTQRRKSVPPDLGGELAADKEYLDRLPTATELPPRDR